MDIVLGYLVVFAYVFILIFALGHIIKVKTNLETSRKLVHTMLFMVWVFIDIFFKNTVHQIVIPIAFLVLNVISYRFKLFKSVERDENNHCGTIYFAIAITVVMAISYFYKELYLASGVASFCLTIGDGFAALVGYNVHSPKVKGSKSLYGFIACFIATLIALFCFKVIWWNTLSVEAVFLISSITAISELVGAGLDNFTVTFCTFGMSWLLEYGLWQPDGNSAVLWAILIFLIVFFSHAIDYPGAVLSMLVVFSFRYFAGYKGLFFLLLTYFTVFSIGLWKKKKNHPARLHRYDRSWLQVAINGGLGTFFVILYGLAPARHFLGTTVVAIGGCFVDSVSSDIGTMSVKEPYDLFKRTYVPHGISGGVSFLGTTAALISSILIGAYSAFVFRFSWKVSVVLCVLIFAQTIIDSMLGSLAQAKYVCVVCNKLTESRNHCGKMTVHQSGSSWIDNNMVNLISSVIITTLSLFVLKETV